MLRHRHSRLSVILPVLFAIGCASTPPYQAPFDARVVVPGPNETVRVSDVLFLVDSSGSVGPDFPSEKALLESFAAGMPDARYSTGTIAFGGFRRETYPLQRFDRSRVRAEAARISYLNEGTPLHVVLDEARRTLAGRGGRAAVILFSDGLPTDYAGRDADPQLSLRAARSLVQAAGGDVCFHTIQIGNSPEGAQLLRQLSGVTDCGSNRLAIAIDDPGALYNFQRQVFLAETLPPVAARGVDTDRDGVLDPDDRCPATPIGAQVDPRGCWSVRGLNFAFDSDAIDPGYEKQLDVVAELLRLNPDIRVRVDGHTDFRGPEAYNQALSERRASAVRDYLVGSGIGQERFEVKGWGETAPAVPNDTAADMAKNRRVELTPIK